MAGLPAGATFAFNPDPAAGNASTLTVTTSANTPAGTYALTISGTSGGLTRTTTVTLVVTNPPPPAPGTITGIVRLCGARCVPAPGATVSTDTGQSTTTLADGSYTLPNVPAGNRTVTASAGNITQSQPVTVPAGGTVTANFDLTIIIGSPGELTLVANTGATEPAGNGSASVAACPPQSAGVRLPRAGGGNEPPAPPWPLVLYGVVAILVAGIVLRRLQWRRRTDRQP